MIPRREHAVRAFTDVFYNCVSTGHSAIIGRTQIKNRAHKLKLADRPGGCWPPVAKHKARETATNQLIMSDRQSDGNSSSAESDDSGRDPFDLPTEDINFMDGSPPSADEFDPSPSQYRAEKLRRYALHEMEEDEA